MFYPVRGSIFLVLLVLIALSTSLISISATHVLSKEKAAEETTSTTLGGIIEEAPLGKSVIANLTDMTIELRDGTSTISIMPILSKGKPGSYYETPGGNYKNDYKKLSHFSSIGHVYMPYSVHVVGNYFIHGIPYYPDGTRVSSTYSGGCIRLSDENAKEVYDFVGKGTSIIITQEDGEDFTNQKSSYTATNSIDMTRLMVATVSLEFLTQDNEIAWHGDTTTRRKLLYNLLVENDDEVSAHFASYYGHDLFIQKMNEKAKSVGLNNTFFRAVTLPAETTEEDYTLFTEYIKQYKSYLLNIPAAEL